MPPTGAPREPGLGTFFVASLSGLLAAFGTWLMFVAYGVFADFFFGVAVTYPAPSLVFALACAGVVGAAAVSARTGAGAARRGCAACLVLTALALGGAYLRTGPLAPEFDAASFRAAVAKEDGEEILDQAHLAIEAGVLDGRSRAEVKRLLGAPYDRGRRDRHWVWNVGEVDSIFGPGDGGTLDVRFDRDGRVRSVTAPAAAD